MILFPAIDLKDGKVVRLYKGDFATVHQVAEDPLETAQAFFDAGARHIHMVDLDGAKDGVRQNSAIVRAVAERSGIRVELGGGIRSMADLEEVFSLGVWRAVIGSAAVQDPELVRAAVARYGARIAVGVDIQDGRVRTAGWMEDSGLPYLDFVKSMDAIGVKTIIFTDIETDGALNGPSFARWRTCGRSIPARSWHQAVCPVRKICAGSMQWDSMVPSLERPIIPALWTWPPPFGREGLNVSKADHSLPGCPGRKGCKGN